MSAFVYRECCFGFVAEKDSGVAGDRVRASPYAQKLAREAGVDISQATATGPEGRIVAADVEKLISSGGGKAAAQKPEAKGKPASQESQSTSEVSHRSTIQTCAVFRLYEHYKSFEEGVTNSSNRNVDLQQARVYTHPSTLQSSFSPVMFA